MDPQTSWFDDEGMKQAKLVQLRLNDCNILERAGRCNRPVAMGMGNTASHRDGTDDLAPMMLRVAMIANKPLNHHVD